MAALKFKENVCSTCPTADCLVKCQYMKFGVKEAHGEMMKVAKGEDSPVLQNVSPVMPVRNIAPEVIIPSISSKSVGKKRGSITAPQAHYQPVDQYDPDAGKADGRGRERQSRLLLFHPVPR